MGPVLRAWRDGCLVAPLPPTSRRCLHCAATIIAAGNIAAPRAHCAPDAASGGSAYRRARRVRASGREPRVAHERAAVKRGRHGYRRGGGPLEKWHPGSATRRAHRAMVGRSGRRGVDRILRHLRGAEQPVASLKRWVGLVLLAWIALAFAYLPPRGA